MHLPVKSIHSPPDHRARSSARARVRPGFTLVEMLVVMAIIVILIGICVPVVTSLKSAGDVGKAVYDVAGVMEQSRAYAMANNTYVYVGLEEVNVTQPTGGQQQAGMGRLGIVVVATNDGTAGFSTSSLSPWSAAYPAFMSDLTVIGKPYTFDNLNILDLGAPPATGNMVRPALTSVTYSVGDSQCVSATPFDYPVGASLGKGQYSFTKVIQFDPQGVARIQTASSPTAIVPYLEIDLQPTHGSTVPSPPPNGAGNVAALQIEGITGAVHIYRP